MALNFNRLCIPIQSLVLVSISAGDDEPIIYCLISSSLLLRSKRSERQQHKQDLRRIYKREYELSKSSLFTRMLCAFLPECIAPSTRVHCATNSTTSWHRCAEVLPFLAWIAVETVSVVVDYLEISICRRWCKVSLERRTHEFYICRDRFIYIQT